MSKTRFVIYGQWRTGSTLLASLLDSHPQVRCYGELFHLQQWQGRLHSRIQGLAFRHPLAYLMTRMFLARRPVVGFKLASRRNRDLAARSGATGGHFYTSTPAQSDL